MCFQCFGIRIVCYVCNKLSKVNVLPAENPEHYAEKRALNQDKRQAIFSDVDADVTS